MNKKVLLALVLMTSCYATNVFAQAHVWATDNLAVNVTVEAGLTLDVATPMDFPNVNPGSGNATIAPTDAAAGHIGITGGPANAAIHVAINPPLALVNGASSITVQDWTMTGDSDVANKGTAGAFPVDGNVTLSAGGAYHIWLGATLVPDPTSITLEGVHTANVEVEVSYQ